MKISEKVMAFYENPPFSTVVGNHIQIHNPFSEPSRREAIENFCRKFYNDQDHRIHILGINPSKINDTSTGVNYTDGYALENFCGINNDFSKSRELTSRFFYSVVEKMGGATSFYSAVFAWAVMPLSVTQEDAYKNYYEDDVKSQLNGAVKSNMEWISQNIPSNGRAVLLGSGDNKKSFDGLDGYPFGYRDIKYLPHPRWVMQYNSAKLDYYVDMYRDALQN